MLSHQRIKGLVAAVHTPFSKDAKVLNLSMVEAQADYLIQQGIHQVLVAGTTGENFKLTQIERQNLIQSWSILKKPSFKIYFNVSDQSVHTAIELALLAQSLKLDGILIMPPTYFKATTIHLLVAIVKQIADSVPNMPCYYYHYPQKTNFSFSLLAILQEIERQKIHNVVGAKFSDTNMYDYMQCIHYQNKKYNILAGNDKQLIAALACGGEGFMGSTYNILAKLMSKLISEFNANHIETARSLQLTHHQIMALGDAFGSDIMLEKEILKLKGIDCGPPRLPQQALSEEEQQSLKVALCKFKSFI
ncbi:MAG: dihydrodipicolinate synthase family protein [Candidatus Berkiella sp.]